MASLDLTGHSLSDLEELAATALRSDDRATIRHYNTTLVRNTRDAGSLGIVGHSGHFEHLNA